MYLNDEAVLKVENLRVGFGEEEKREVVRNISFQIKKGEVLCLVGESGSGKSVTAFSIMQLFHGTTGMILGGKILVNGTNLAELSEKEMQKRRGNEIAMVFQEPMTSLNPVITIGVQMARAMRLHQKLEKQKVREKSIQLLEKVGIKHAEKTLYAYPHEVSGGMRQRIMIAMAMINKPSLLICDEPTSALDVIVQDQIIKLIKSLCVQEEMAVLFITHDMSVVAQIADQIAVMHHGKIVESDEKKKILFCPKNEYTKRLICDAMAMQKEKNEESDILSDKINEQIILKVSDLKKYYKMPGEKLLEKSRKFVALEDISFELRKGETIGIVGESGCGKTTLGQLICGIQTKSDGNIQYAEKAQIIFQDPYSSLNPKMKVEDLIAEPYDAKHRYKKKNTKETESSSEETTQSSQTTTASNTTSGDKATDSSQMVPAELVGTWTGTTEIAKDVQMTVAADGTVTTTANFYQADVNPIRTATTRAKAVQASGNIYYWETDEPGAFDALLPGIAGLGGANMKVKPGFILEEGHYTPIVFVTGLNEDFDYSKYNDFRVSLTK